MTTQELVANAPDYIKIVGSIIGTASVIAAVTPTPADDGVLLVARKILDILACNFGHARNAK